MFDTNHVIRTIGVNNNQIQIFMFSAEIPNAKLFKLDCNDFSG